MSAAARLAAAAGAPVSRLSRYRGALVAAVLGDCVGGEFEGAQDVPLDRVLQHLSALDDETRGDGEDSLSQTLVMSRQNTRNLYACISPVLVRSWWWTPPCYCNIIFTFIPNSCGRNKTVYHMSIYISVQEYTLK